MPSHDSVWFLLVHLVACSEGYGGPPEIHLSVGSETDTCTLARTDGCDLVDESAPLACEDLFGRQERGKLCQAELNATGLVYVRYDTAFPISGSAFDPSTAVPNSIRHVLFAGDRFDVRSAFAGAPPLATVDDALEIAFAEDAIVSDIDDTEDNGGDAERQALYQRDLGDFIARERLDVPAPFKGTLELSRQECTDFCGDCGATSPSWAGVLAILLCTRRRFSRE